MDEVQIKQAISLLKFVGKKIIRDENASKLVNAKTTLSEIEVRIKNLESNWDEFQKVFCSLIDIQEEVNVEEFEARYINAKSLLVEAQKIRTKEQTPTTKVNSTSMDVFLDQQQLFLKQFAVMKFNTEKMNEIRLPKITIPSFSGDYKEWQCFQDLFEASVHNKANISGAHKFQYLKGYLKGDAAALVRHIPVTDKNYEEAWNKLKSRYDKKKHIVSAFIKTFTSQTAMTNANTNSLRKLCDVSDEVIRGLKSLGPKAEERDPWLIHILSSKLDSDTRQQWAIESAENDLPCFEEFLEFLNKRCDALETSQTSHKRLETYRAPIKQTISTHHTTESSCRKCQEKHPIYFCQEFKSMSGQDRRKFVEDNHLCFNCLLVGHSVTQCRSKILCKICTRKHHTLLHYTSNITNSNQSPVSVNATNVSETVEASTSNQSSADEEQNLNVFTSTTQFGQSLLPTALVYIKDSTGQLHICRALLDSGSMASFITESLVQRLHLSRSHARVSISGLAAAGAGVSKGKVEIELYSRINSSDTIALETLILPKLTSLLPTVTFNVKKWHNINKLALADPSFHQPNQIDIIIGADKFFHIIRDGRINGPDGLLAQSTVFGWIISGKYQHSDTKIACNSSVVNLHADMNIDTLLQKFWEMEEVSNKKHLNEDETKCENRFQNTVQRGEDGKLIVRLPFKETKPNLGSSFLPAHNRLMAMERRFASNPEFKRDYANFMEEYKNLGHMQEIPQEECRNIEKPCYYLPHHAVIKSSSTTTKLRVVFDASAKSNNKVSLNDMLLVGPTIQEGLLPLLIKFRIYKIVFTADIEKMYRMIKVHDDDVDYQRILWRNDSTEPMQHYRLMTVTYGTAAAPYLATKSLQYVAQEILKDHPEASHIIANDFYVDDMMTGANSVEEAKYLQTSVTNILQQYGFNLRKFASNHPELLQSLDEENLQISAREISEDSTTIKVLGLQWTPGNDSFSFKVNLNNQPIWTKRTFLSEASKIFDPIGWLSPSIIIVKILFQELWLHKLNWDSKLPSNVLHTWTKLRQQLSDLEEITIPRWLRITTSAKIELHGFADASEKAYAAAVYLRCIDEEGNIQVNLVTAKTKVSPIKQISIPRLELCAATLLTKLMKSTEILFNKNEKRLHAWSDSTIVLSWLDSHPRRWKTYVANRVSEILSFWPRDQWNHVSSQHNPADLASRGVTPSELKYSTLWWKGPAWLSEDNSKWPRQKLIAADMEEINTEVKKVQTSTFTAVLAEQTNFLEDLISKYSSWSKLLRVTAWCFKFCDKLKNIKLAVHTPLQITTNEIQRSSLVYIKLAQASEYLREINQLANKNELNKKSKLLSLNPFVDSCGVLRVGGRIENAAVSYDTKHPIILPASHILTKMIIREKHSIYLHAGQSLLISILKQHFWIPQCKNAVKKVIHECTICFRYKKKKNEQLMGNLPASRVQPSRPFLKTGIDYAGPMQIRTAKGRTGKIIKCYVAVFVCMCTKAIHLELVGDMTTDSFLAALKRFFSRRGVSSDLYSDNGSNFIGANNELKELNKLFNLHINNPLIKNFLLHDRVTWHFIPPASPSFGGLWESNIKSMKYHLKRVLGKSILTYEEMNTLLAGVEGLLNSRPLCRNTEDELNPLTPAHFLIGHPLTQLPEPGLEHISINRLSRWQLVQSMLQGYWNRWRQEYLTSLQQRTKWQAKSPNLQVDDVVLVGEDNTPCGCWLLARVMQTHPGKDNITRVCTIKTKTGIFKRPSSKLYKLPIDNS